MSTGSTSNTRLPQSIQHGQCFRRGHWERPYVHPRRMVLAWRRTRTFLVRPLWHLLRILSALRSEGHSLCGRMRIALSKSRWVGFGPMYSRLPSGSLIPNVRTVDRIDGTRELMLAHPRASTVDMKIYLQGFDRGERFALGKMGRSELEPIASELPRR